jgi:hypothetical protein
MLHTELIGNSGGGSEDHNADRQVKAALMKFHRKIRFLLNLDKSLHLLDFGKDFGFHALRLCGSPSLKVTN